MINLQVSFSLIFLLLSTGLFAQPVMEVEGSIKVGNNTDPNPELGTIRWSGSDFEVWNGFLWASLTDKKLGTVEDIDGNEYKTLIIGNQIWMIENLRVSHFNDGTIINNIENFNVWKDIDVRQSAWCWYDNSAENNLVFGKLYNGFAVLNEKKICPSGWKVPSEDDWLELADHLGGLTIAGGKMKRPGLKYWITDIQGQNSSGFSGVGGGMRDAVLDFRRLKVEGFWWSSSGGFGCTHSGASNLIYDKLSLEYDSEYWFTGLSVRCLKD